MINKHLNHVEDLIFLSSPEEAFWWLKEAVHFLDQNHHSHLDFSVKWDGAPAFVCGINPENGKYFVGTKSVFNKKDPKIAYDFSDIENMYGVGELGDKLQSLLLSDLRTLTLNNGRIFQGDFIADHHTLMWNNVLGLTAQPNLLRYALPFLIGGTAVVLHTEYVGDSISNLEAKYKTNNISLPSPGMNPITILPTEIDKSDISIKTFMLTYLHQTVGRIQKMLPGINRKMLQYISETPKVEEILSLYINHCVREGDAVSGSNFISFLINHYSTWAKFLVTERGKENKRKELETILSNLQTSDLDFMFLIHVLMADLKNNIIEKFDVADPTDIKVFALDNIPTFHEGYVATSRTVGYKDAVKFVNRPRFSRLNMTATKAWQNENS